MQVEAIPLEVLSILDAIDYIFTKDQWNYRTNWHPGPQWVNSEMWTKWLDDNKNGTQSIRIYLYDQSIVIYEFLDGALNINKQVEFLLEDPKCFDKLREYAKNKDS